ncbi:hypothetical protein KIPB_005944 [Kipferlia bialata]|uniref:D-glutamate cyclase-like C-terminal domain-containing protein n=1 Tax=Kipferlia bialata TaxID=797122 RepID=A0A9K3CWV1_9EUKA|nr:hypothetical protein KIPB_005944 [Kipferlia bialata]|eukprot:g5944.t1
MQQTRACHLIILYTIQHSCHHSMETFPKTQCDTLRVRLKSHWDAVAEMLVIPGTRAEPLHSRLTTDTGGLYTPQQLDRALGTIGTARRVLLTTGFYVPGTQTESGMGGSESDGPPGTALLCLSLLGLSHISGVGVVTERCNEDVVSAALSAVGVRDRVTLHVLPDTEGPLPYASDYDTLISIEKCGVAADGTFRVSALVQGWDKDRTVGVADGGNEIGCGSILSAVHECVTNGSTIACVVPCSALILASVSNWGGYALAALLNTLSPTPLPLDGLASRARAAEHAVLDAGGVHGLTGGWVDGLPVAAHDAFWVKMEGLVERLAKGE